MRSMTDKLMITLIFCVVMVSGLFAGGGQQGSRQPEVIEIRVASEWVGESANAAPLASIIEAFNGSQDRIRVIHEFHGGTTTVGSRETMEASFLSGQAPHIIFENVEGSPREWYLDGYLLDTEPLANRIGINRFKSAAVIEATRHVESGWLGIPISGYVWPMWYNKAILDQIGEPVPQTWEDLIRASAKARAAGFIPWAMGGSDWNFEKVPYLAIAGSIGASAYQDGLIGAENSSFLNLPGTRAGLNLLEQAMAAGVFQDDFEGYDWSSALEMYLSGNAMAYWMGNWSWNRIPEDLLQNTVLAGFPIPANGASNKPLGISAFGNKLFMISSTANDRLEAVYEFAEFFFQTNQIDKFVLGSSMISPLVETNLTSADVSPLLIQSTTLFGELQMVDLIDYAPTQIYEQLVQHGRAFSTDAMNTERLITAMRSLYR